MENIELTTFIPILVAVVVVILLAIFPLGRRILRRIQELVDLISFVLDDAEQKARDELVALDVALADHPTLASKFFHALLEEIGPFIDSPQDPAVKWILTQLKNPTIMRAATWLFNITDETVTATQVARVLYEVHGKLLRATDDVPGNVFS